MGYFYVTLCIVFTVYGQLVLKWQMNKATALPVEFHAKMVFLLSQLLNPWILSCFFAGFLAALAWMAAMSVLDLSTTYPFIGLAFILVLFLSALFLDEPLSRAKFLGTFMVVAGLIIITR